MYVCEGERVCVYVSVSVCECVCMFYLDGDVISSKSLTGELFPHLVNSSLVNVVGEDQRVDAAAVEVAQSTAEMDETQRISNSRSDNKDVSGREFANDIRGAKVEVGVKDVNEMEIANLFEHFLIVGAAPEVCIALYCLWASMCSIL